MEKITYTYREKTGDNCADIYEFIGPQPPCPKCNNTGEYEDDNGVHGCMPCCSRLIQFIDKNGDRVDVDWGDTIIKHEDGSLELIVGDDNEL